MDGLLTPTNTKEPFFWPWGDIWWRPVGGEGIVVSQCWGNMLTCTYFFWGGGQVICRELAMTHLLQAITSFMVYNHALPSHLR